MFSIDYMIHETVWGPSSVKVTGKARYTLLGMNSSWLFSDMDIPYDPGQASISWRVGDFEAEHSAYITHSTPRKVITRLQGHVTLSIPLGKHTEHFDERAEAIEG